MSIRGWILLTLLCPCLYTLTNQFLSATHSGTVVVLKIGFAVVASQNEHRLNYYSIQYNDNCVQNKDYCYRETLLLLLSSQHNYTWYVSH